MTVIPIHRYCEHTATARVHRRNCHTLRRTPRSLLRPMTSITDVPDRDLCVNCCWPELEARGYPSVLDEPTRPPRQRDAQLWSAAELVMLLDELAEKMPVFAGLGWGDVVFAAARCLERRLSSAERGRARKLEDDDRQSDLFAMDRDEWDRERKVTDVSGAPAHSTLPCDGYEEG